MSLWLFLIVAFCSALQHVCVIFMSNVCRNCVGMCVEFVSMCVESVSIVPTLYQFVPIYVESLSDVCVLNSCRICIELVSSLTVVC